MVLKSPGLDDPENRTRILAPSRRTASGRERIEILARARRYEHLAAYAQIDIQLDPFPHGGGATTFEGLLQGVPCVTLLGERIRAGLGLVPDDARAGRPDRPAPDQYIEIAARLAADPDRLAHERETLRQRLLASPVADRDLYTRAVEAAYRELWRPLVLLPTSTRLRR